MKRRPITLGDRLVKALVVVEKRVDVLERDVGASTLAILKRLAELERQVEGLMCLGNPCSE